MLIRVNFPSSKRGLPSSLASEFEEEISLNLRSLFHFLLKRRTPSQVVIELFQMYAKKTIIGHKSPPSHLLEHMKQGNDIVPN